MYHTIGFKKFVHRNKYLFEHMFANASVNFLTDQQHCSLKKNGIWGSKTRSSFNFHGKTCAFSFFYGVKGRRCNGGKNKNGTNASFAYKSSVT